MRHISIVLSKLLDKMELILSIAKIQHPMKQTCKKVNKVYSTIVWDRKEYYQVFIMQQIKISHSQDNGVSIIVAVFLIIAKCQTTYLHVKALTKIKSAVTIHSVMLV